MNVAALGGTHGAAVATPRTRGWVALIWIISFGAILVWLWPLAMIFDSDSYYHLAIAREYAQHGVISELPWARFSAMRHGFGDKEFLFHWLLMPFASAADPLRGAKLALALLGATSISSFAGLARAALGKGGLWLAALLVCGSQSFDLRLIRLRPELLALTLLLWSVWALAQRRPWLLAALSGTFALAYTAFHALLGIILFGWAGMLWSERRVRAARSTRAAVDRAGQAGTGEPPDRAPADAVRSVEPEAAIPLALVALPLMAAGLALWLHPHFPDNLRIFYLQNVVFWKFGDSADVGTEIRPLGWLPFFNQNWALLTGCAVLALSLERGPEATAAGLTPPRRAAWCFGVAALVFCGLFLRSARFALYALPFGLLALAWFARARGLRLGRRLGSRGPRSGLVLALVCCASLPLTAAAMREVVDRGGSLWPAQRLQLEAFGRALPAGAKVAAPWASAEDYMFFAPQGRYLNVLDPIFMRAADERAYLAQRQLFDGELSDLPLALQSQLDSDYLGFNARSLPRLHDQVRRDPRLTPLIGGGQALYRFEPTGNRAFSLDWRVAPGRSQLQGAERYPRPAEPRARAAEGIVDAGRVAGAKRCLWFVSSEPLEPGHYEFDATAAARVWHGGRQWLMVEPHPQLTLGAGQALELLMPAQPVEVELCSGDKPGQFYLVRR